MTRFGNFRLDLEKRRLWNGNQELLITPKAMDVLVYLAARAGQVVSKEELFSALWPGTFVSDHALTVQIREIRKSLGDQPHDTQYIETRHRRGYRFVPEPGATSAPDAEPPPPAPAPAAAAPIPAVAFQVPETRYARSGDVNIAYQVIGDGPVDIVFVMGWVSHLEYFWTEPHFSAFLRRLASFSRLILFDKRGTGLSDRVPVDQLPTLEQRMDDVRAVMDAAGSRAAVIVGISEGGPMSALFAATYPRKTIAMVMIGTYAKRIRDESYPWGPTATQRAAFLEVIRNEWGGPVGIDERAPSLAGDDRFRNWWATYLRMGASPSAAIALTRMNAEIDVRHVLEAVRVPTLVLHRSGDRCLLADEGRYVASHIPGARFVELPGADHLPFVGNQDEILDEIEDFVSSAGTERRAEQVLATVLLASFEDARARPAAEAAHALHMLSERSRQEIEWFRGRPRHRDAEHLLVATFDGPARALRCASALARHAARSGFQARAALHTGECELAEENRIAGVAAEVSGRILERAASGEILASSTVRDLVAGSGIRFSAAGALAKDAAHREWRLYRVDRGGEE